MRKAIQILLLVVASAATGPVLAQADPTVHQIYQAAEAGNLTQAQQMMNQVLRDHPQSAKAHYVAAELYAREGNLASSRQELSTAQTLAPGLPFEKPESVRALERQLSGRPARVSPAFAPATTFSRAHSSIPWGLILIIGACVAVLWAVMRRRAAAGYGRYPGGVPAAAGPGGYGTGYGPGYGPGYGGPGVGSGIAGGLASGLAVGAGVVAGEELAHHFLDRDGNPLPPPADPGSYPQNSDMGGNDFGVSDSSSWDDGGGSGGDFGGGDSGGGDWS